MRSRRIDSATPDRREWIAAQGVARRDDEAAPYGDHSAVAGAETLAGAVDDGARAFHRNGVLRSDAGGARKARRYLRRAVGQIIGVGAFERHGCARDHAAVLRLAVAPGFDLARRRRPVGSPGHAADPAMHVVRRNTGAADEQAGVITGTNQSEPGLQEQIDPPEATTAQDAAAGAAGEAIFGLAGDVGRPAILAQECPVERVIFSLRRRETTMKKGHIRFTDFVFQSLSIAAIPQPARAPEMVIRLTQPVEIVSRRVFGVFVHARPDKPAAFPHSAGPRATFAAQRTLSRLRWSLQTSAVGIKVPAVIAASKAVALVATEIEAGQPTRVEFPNQSFLARHLAEGQQHFAKRPDAFGRRAGREFAAGHEGPPIMAHELAHRRIGTGSGQRAFVFLAQHATDLYRCQRTCCARETRTMVFNCPFAVSDVVAKLEEGRDADSEPHAEIKRPDPEPLQARGDVRFDHNAHVSSSGHSADEVQQLGTLRSWAREIAGLA